jgi:hypothetical protein
MLYIYFHKNLHGVVLNTRTTFYILYRAGFSNLFNVAVPLTSIFISHGTPWGKHLIFIKLIYFLIISYVRDIIVYWCWVSIYALINYVILFIYFIFLNIAVPQGTAEPRLGIIGIDLTYTNITYVELKCLQLQQAYFKYNSSCINKKLCYVHQHTEFTNITLSCRSSAAICNSPSFVDKRDVCQGHTYFVVNTST